MDNPINTFKKAVAEAKDILIIQADNPDADSLGSSLALEQIFHQMGKNPVMYCPTQIARHLRYIPGWDRVETRVNGDFDMAIVVDCSARSLLDKALDTIGRRKFTNRPLFIIDHHTTESDLDIGHAIIDDSAVASAEQVYSLATELDWPLDATSGYAIAAGIMADSLGLSSSKTTARSVRVIAELLDIGVKLYELDDARRQLMRRDRDLTELKARLINEVQYVVDDRLATIDIDWPTIETYSDRYNPSMLVMDEMRLTIPVEIAIAYKTYPDGRITAKLRSNLSAPCCHQIAEAFGGGGHPHSAGFRVEDGRQLSQIKAEVINLTTELLNNHDSTTN